MRTPALILTCCLLAVPHGGRAAQIWWDNDSGDGALNNTTNWDISISGTNGNPGSLAGNDAVVSVSNFVGTLPAILDASLSLGSLSFNTEYWGDIVITSTAPRVLTLTGTTAIGNTNDSQVFLGSNINVIANNGGIVTINGGTGVAVTGGLDRADNTRRTDFFGDVTLGRFYGNRRNLTLGGSGALTLVGGNSDLRDNVTLADSLQLTLSGTGQAMLDTVNVILNDTARLQLDAANQLSDSWAVAVNSNAMFSLAGRNETIGDLNGSGTVELMGAVLSVSGGSFGGTMDAGTLDKRGTGTLSITDSNVFSGTLSWNAGSGTINLNAAKAFSIPVTVRTGNVLGFYAEDALNAQPITINTCGGMMIGGAVSNINSAVTTSPYAAIMGNTAALSPAQLGALAFETVVGADPYTPLTGMPPSNLIAGLTGDLDLAADLPVDPSGLLGPGYLGIAAAGANRTVGDSDSSGDALVYEHSLHLAAKGGFTLTIDVPITDVGAGPVTVGGSGTVRLDTTNSFTGTATIDDDTRLELDCDPDDDKVPDLGALGAPANTVSIGTDATLAFSQVYDDYKTVTGILAMAAHSLLVSTASTIEVGAALDVQVQPGAIACFGGGLVKTGAGKLTLLGSNPPYNATTVTVIQAGVLELRTADALGLRDVEVSAGAVYGVTFNASQADLDRVGTNSTGIFGINGPVANNLDLTSYTLDTTGPGSVPDGVADSATLFVGSSTTGVLAGTLTGTAIDTNANGTLDRGVVQLGGGGGTLIITSDLADVNPGTGDLPTDLVGSGSGGSDGLVVLAGTNTVTGRIIPNETVFVFMSTSAIPAATDIEVGTGPDPVTPGNSRFTPLVLNRTLDVSGLAPQDVWLDGGQVAWHDTAGPATKALTSLSQVGRYWAGTGTPSQVTLGLGAPLANVSMAMNFAVTNWDHDTNGLTPAVPVLLVKDGEDSVLDMQGQSHTYSGGTLIQAGTVRIDTNGLGGATMGDVTIREEATLEVTAITTLSTSLWAGATGRFLLGNDPRGLSHINILDRTLTVNAPLKTIVQDGTFRVMGGGMLYVDTATEVPGGDQDQWGLYIQDGCIVSLDQQARSNSKYCPNVAFGGTGGTLRMRVDGGIPIPESGGGHGWRRLIVEPGAVGTVNVAAGMRAVFSGIRPHQISGTAIKTGPGEMWLCNHQNATTGYTGGGGTIDIREGTLLWLGHSPYYAWQGQLQGWDSSITIKIQGGATWRVDNHTQPTKAALVVNDLASPGNATINLTGTHTIDGTGNTEWYGNLRKIGGSTLTIARTGGTTTVTPGATLLVEAGQVNVGGSVDPFTDSSSPTNNVDATLQGTLRITAGAKQVGLLSGTGSTTVDLSAELGVRGFSPGTGVVAMAVNNSGTFKWAGGGTSTFEVHTDNQTNDFVQVNGDLSIDAGSEKITIDVALAGGASPPSNTLYGIEILNASSIQNFDANDFVLNPDAQLTGLARITKGPGTAGGESLYIGSTNARPVTIDAITIETNTVTLYSSVTNPPDWFALQRSFDLMSNDWVTITSIWITSPSNTWYHTVSNAWSNVFYRLRRQ